jgi:hypothetical protein
MVRPEQKSNVWSDELLQNHMIPNFDARIATSEDEDDADYQTTYVALDETNAEMRAEEIVAFADATSLQAQSKRRRSGGSRKDVVKDAVSKAMQRIYKSEGGLRPDKAKSSYDVASKSHSQLKRDNESLRRRIESLKDCASKRLVSKSTAKGAKVDRSTRRDTTANPVRKRKASATKSIAKRKRRRQGRSKAPSRCIRGVADISSLFEAIKQTRRTTDSYWTQAYKQRPPCMRRARSHTLHKTTLSVAMAKASRVVHSNIGPTSVVGCKEAEALATWLPQMSRSFEYAFNCIVSAAIDEVAANASDIRACAYSSNKLKKMRRLAIDGRSIDMAFEIFAKRHPCLFSCATTLC